MDDEYISTKQHQEFVERMKIEHQRLDDENERQNERIKELENDTKQITNLTLSIQELASSVKTIAKETERLGVKMEEGIKSHDDRLQKIENRDGEKWRDVVHYLITTVLAILIGLLSRQIGL